MKNFKLVAFDLDGVLVDFGNHYSSWDFFHEQIGVSEKAELFKEKFLKKQITYEEWANLDIHLWKSKGISKESLLEFVAKAKMIPNALQTIQSLRNKGFKTALISGSLDFVFEKFFQKNLFEYVFLNSLKFKNGLVEGVVTGCADDKLNLLEKVCINEGISLKQAVFVGDNFNDVEAVREAGLGIAFMPKCKQLEEVADIVIREKNLAKILNLL